MRTKNAHEKVAPTAWLVAYDRTFSDIPYVKEIFDEVERIRTENGEPELDSRLKTPELAPQFEARYKLVDLLLKRTKVTQVLEIASGLSPRGLIYSEKNGFEYAEVDLPKVMNLKREILKGVKGKLPSSLHLIDGDALKIPDLMRAASILDKRKPLAVINEGLLRYFNFNEKETVAKNIRLLLESFDHGVWITPDITLKKLIQSENEMVKGHSEFIKQTTGINIDQNRFDDVEQARMFFENLKFDVEIHKITEIKNMLVSPKQLHLSEADVENVLGPAVVFVMRPR